IQSIISDDAGGAIISWSDAGSGSFSDNFAQHINASGTNLWGGSGVSICDASNNQSSPAVIKDAAGGYIFAWNDFRNGINWDVYAQRLDATGVIQWAFNGIPVAVTSNDQLGSNLVSDGSGGAIITWTDDRASAVGLTDIYAQRVNSSGVVQWASNGLTVCTATDFQFSPEIISDGSGGAIICWYDGRVAGFDIYAQRINSSGTAQWLLNGVAISAAASNQREQKIVEDGAGGAIMIWMDYRNGNEDIYAQRVDAAGNVLWTSNGVAVSIAADLQAVPELAGNGSGGDIIAWQDNRNAGVADIYTQGISGNGLLPLKLVSFNAVYNSGNHAADISWQTSNEINTRLFDIQKSEDAIDFTTIGKIDARGNTSSTSTYSFTDTYPFKVDQDYSYYRLKLIDNNGNYTYSKTVSIKANHLSPLAIYPNPAADQLSFSLNAGQNEKTFFSITDIYGNKLLSRIINLKKGNNLFVIDISSLPPGAYLLRIGNQNKYNDKFLKIPG
ncbi:MAG: T9SS type A sorting domain-containing protein, partial [Chitinophagales bacterium]